MPSVLVTVPVRPGLDAGLRNRSHHLADYLAMANPDFQCSLHFDYSPAPPVERRASRIAIIRNRLIKIAIHNDFDYMMVIDADLVDYPADLLTRLWKTNPDGISAPVVLIENTTCFYDWAGFILRLDPDEHICCAPNYWTEEFGGDVGRMLSVGSCYLANTAVLRQGARYACHPYTEHFPFCAGARAAGLPVTADRRIKVYHADLPSHGEAWH